MSYTTCNCNLNDGHTYPGWLYLGKQVRQNEVSRQRPRDGARVFCKHQVLEARKMKTRVLYHDWAGMDRKPEIELLRGSSALVFTVDGARKLVKALNHAIKHHDCQPDEPEWEVEDYA